MLHIHSTKSARWPAASTPRSVRPKAAAAWRVTPARASSDVKRNSVQVMFSISNKDVHGELPGLQSVDTAIGTPWVRSSAIGGTRVSRKK